jgi:hypothetical protein
MRVCAATMQASGAMLGEPVPNRKVEEQIERLSLVRDLPPAEAAAALQKALGDRVNLVAAKAAKVAAGLQLRELVPELLHAFDRLFENGAARDPQCWGKNAIAKALVDLDCRESAPFVRGVRHVQMEAVWGGQEDTAPALRGTCLLALAACSDLTREQVFRHIVDALTDAAATVRIEAVRALEQMGGGEGALLLRLKAAAGDRETRVIGQAFDSLLNLERGEALDFVARFLADAPDEVREEAALAMGASRLPDVSGLLCDAWERERDPRFRAVLLRGISMSRQPKAIEFLLGLVRAGRARDRADALEALEIHRDSPEIWKQVEALTATTG